MSCARRRFSAGAIAILVLASAASARAQDAGGPACGERPIDGRHFVVCDFTDAALARLRIAAAPDPQSRAWTFQRLDSILRAGGQRLVFATNAGIFAEDGRPLGLLVADGRTVHPLDTTAGPAVRPPADICDVANFYCPPNGVFFVDSGRGGILATADFAARPRGVITLATQSGPMLLHHGQFARDFPSTWRRRIARTAACIRGDGTTSLILGDDQTAASFATALRDSLACHDALFLDGHISAMYTGVAAVPETRDFGAILYVSAPLTAADTVAPTMRHGRPAPYSRLTMRGGATRLRTLDQLHQYYPGGTGMEFEVETPFEFGVLGLTVNSMLLRGATAQQVDTKTQTIAIDWQGLVPLSPRVALRAGARIGDYNMVFNEPNPIPGKDYGTHEFLVGPSAALDAHVFGPIGASLTGTWLYLPSSSSMHFGYLSLLGTFDTGMPGWLRRILR